ncbi:MAG: hypothetical protein V2A66_09845 [Pseudomonadota bacterium]
MSDIQVRSAQIDTSGDGRIDDQEWNKWYTKLTNRDPAAIVNITDDQGRVIYTAKLQDLISSMNGQTQLSDSAGVVDLYAKAAATLNGEMSSLLAKIKDAQKNGVAEAEVEKMQEQLRGMIDNANKLFTKAGNKSLFDLTEFNKAAAMEEGSGAKASTINTQSGGEGSQASGAKAQTTGGGGSAATFPPAGWAAQTAGGQQFNSSAYLQSLNVQDNVMNSWDAINQDTNKGKQLMQLFFYFAKMAESGDMGSMYQFMKFITYIISKDKAKQQIEMGQKLIQLQDLSRSWTNKLMGMSSNANDPNASNELMKTMTIVKSETDSIATSQKLISQMMEEFAQVVETLTNTTKAALETNGRIQRTVSTIRG